MHLLQGYAERKVLLLCDVVRAAKELHAAGAKQERAKVQAACRQVGLVGVPAGGRRQGCGALALALTGAWPPCRRSKQATGATFAPFGECFVASSAPPVSHGSSSIIHTWTLTAGPLPAHMPLQSPAKLQALSGSPNPKVQWGSLTSSSRLRKLPDTTATDASQSMFVPAGSGAPPRSLGTGTAGWVDACAAVCSACRSWEQALAKL